jgi:hypothetical protein
MSARHACALVPLLLGALLALPGCQWKKPQGMPAYEMRERFRAVKEGQTVREVHNILRRPPIRKPGHPDDPFPTPLHIVEFERFGHPLVRIETYVVATRLEKGCPDFGYDDRPVVFIDGIVAGLSWEFVEWRWQEWGGELARLRQIQDRHHCPEALRQQLEMETE